MPHPYLLEYPQPVRPWVDRGCGESELSSHQASPMSLWHAQQPALDQKLELETSLQAIWYR